jgi:hypothetical protein
MIGLAMKPRDVYETKKTKIEWETKILFFTLNHSSIDVWRWIFVQNMRSKKEIFIYAKLK